MKCFKWLIPLIIFICSFMIYKDNVQASEVLHGQITPTLARLYTSNGLINANFDNTRVAQIRLSGDNISTLQSLGIFFNTNTYYGYTNYRYKFSGYLNSYNYAYSTITGVFIQNGNGTITGVCEYTANGNQTNYQSFSLDCLIPNGLNSGDYSNIMIFQFSTTGNTPNNNTLFDVYIESNYALYKVDDSNANIVNNTETIKNDIKDSSIDNNNTSSSANTWADKNATNGTITNLLTLPISLLQNILNGIQTSCSNFSLGTLFGTELILPCINLSDLIGSTLFSVIDLLFSGFMILNIAKKLIKIFNDFTNLKSNQIDEIYSNGGGAS